MACFEVGSSNVTEIPNACVSLIFQGLQSFSDRNSFGLTCHQWLQIQNSARRSLKFPSYHGTDASSLYTEYLPKSLCRFQHLQSPSLMGCCQLPDTALTQLKFLGSNLENLYLDCCCNLTDNGITTLCARCPNLLIISFYRCNITDAGLDILAKSCPALQHVNLKNCTQISDNGLGAVSRECRKLKSLIISRCRGITGTGLTGCSPTLAFLEAESCFLSPEGLLGVVSGGGLEHLDVSFLSSRYGNSGLNAIGVGFARKLRSLNLRTCRFVNDDIVTAISKECPVLYEWNLVLCHEVKLPGWEAISLYCRNLEKLHVNRCRNLCDDGLQALQNGCSRLRVLYMQGCRGITTVGFESFKRMRWEVEISAEEHMTNELSFVNFLAGI